MADASKLKSLRRGGLGAPPALDEARIDLAAPAPAATQRETISERQQMTQSATLATGAVRLDGRTMRRSGRTVQFATRVSPAFDERIRLIAMREGMLLVEVLEHALEAYEHNKKERLPPSSS
jgi:hypothetical protein